MVNEDRAIVQQWRQEFVGTAFEEGTVEEARSRKHERADRVGPPGIKRRSGCRG
jgi:hypothetical protein